MAATTQVRLLVWSDSCLRNTAPMPNVMPHGGTTEGQCWAASPRGLWRLLPARRLLRYTGGLPDALAAAAILGGQVPHEAAARDDQVPRIAWSASHALRDHIA